MIEWGVTDSNMVESKDWNGTKIIFKLNKTENGIELTFSHVDWKSETECYKKCTGGWQFYLNSLKSYLETGQGQPYNTEEHKNG